MVNPITQFEIPAEVSNTVLTKALDLSGLNNLARVEYTSSGKNLLTYDLGLSDAQFRNNVTEDNNVSTESVNPVEVKMVSLYKIIMLEEYTKDAVPALIQTIKETVPAKLAETLQKAIFGPTAIPSSPFAGFGTPEVINIADPDALAGVADEVEGYPTGWIFNRKAKSLLNKAYNSGANSNSLRDGITDGDLVAGIPAYFSSISPAVTDLAGVVGDFDQSILVMGDTVNIQMVDGSTDFEMMKADATAIKVGIRVGFATGNAGSFKAFAHKAA